MRYLDPARPRTTRYLGKRLSRYWRQQSFLKVTSIALVAVVIWGLVNVGWSPMAFLKKIFAGPPVVFSFIFDGNSLKNTNGRTNILLLGTGGAGHQGGDLTDTIMVLSIDSKNKDAALISIPRDFWVDSLGMKVNAVYAVANGSNHKDNRLAGAKTVVGEILGIPIHYGLRIDFAGFEKIIDAIGGIEVMVERSFDDYHYPIAGKENDNCGYRLITEETTEGTVSFYVDANGQRVPAGVNVYACRFEHIHFEQGLTHMDGSTALKFVRSRMGTNNEGSDFARAARQQKVLAAVKDKVFSTQTLLNPQRVMAIGSTLGASLDTDITSEEIFSFFKIARQFDQVNLRSLVLDDTGPNSLLVNPPPNDYNGQWVLIPRDGDYERLRQIVKQFVYLQPDSLKAS